MHLDICISRGIAKLMHLEKLKQLIIWNKGSTSYCEMHDANGSIGERNMQECVSVWFFLEGKCLNCDATKFQPAPPTPHTTHIFFVLTGNTMWSGPVWMAAASPDMPWADRFGTCFFFSFSEKK